jgi:hypothetical protein
MLILLEILNLLSVSKFFNINKCININIRVTPKRTQHYIFRPTLWRLGVRGAWMLRAVTRWLNISECLGIELFSPVLVFGMDVRGTGHQSFKGSKLKPKSKKPLPPFYLVLFLFIRDAVRECFVVWFSLAGNSLTFSAQNGKSCFYSMRLINLNFRLLN